MKQLWERMDRHRLSEADDQLRAAERAWKDHKDRDNWIRLLGTLRRAGRDKLTQADFAHAADVYCKKRNFVLLPAGEPRFQQMEEGWLFSIGVTHFLRSQEGSTVRLGLMIDYDAHNSDPNPCLSVMTSSGGRPGPTPGSQLYYAHPVHDQASLMAAANDSSAGSWKKM